MWVVLLGPAERVWGPFDDEEQAWEFARFASEEIDPAYVRPLISPVTEVLAWRDHFKDVSDLRSRLRAAADTVHPDTSAGLRAVRTKLAAVAPPATATTHREREGS